ncbi:MAG TPA: cyclic nucleotide-binding domain-containing protein [Mariprofundaceae bacterium]|nr:cyclic nucleotide-binding domain-containing protein [Mariprofundaceae bacterium]
MAVDYNEIFRQARAASAANDFETARRLYAQMWQSPIWRRDREVQLHYAYSCERTGDYTEAMDAYKSLMEHYNSSPDEEAALVEESMVRMREMMAESEQDMSARVVDSVRDESEARLIGHLFDHAYERNFAAGEKLCSLGDPAGHMWLLVSGEVDVLVPGESVRAISGSEKRPCMLGELAYFTGMRRAATLCCATDVLLLELPYERIETLLSEDETLRPMLEHLFRHRLVLRILSQHDLFKLFNDVDRRRVTMCFENTAMHAGQILIEQGVEDPNAFLVQSGTMLLIKRKGDGSEELLSSMHPGDMFHLGGLLRGFASPYRVVAGTPTRLLRMPRHRFEPFMQARPWLIKSILKLSRMSSERQILHPEAKNLWATNRYIDMDTKSSD